MSPMMLDDTCHGQPTNKRKHFTVIPAKPNDVRRLVDIEFHAFENERVNQVLSYRDYKKPSHFERSVKIYDSALSGAYSVQAPQASEQRPSNDAVSFRKVVDTKTGQLISFTKYEMKTYTTGELNSPADVGHKGEPKMNRDWFALNERLRREYIGTQEHCYIGMLATAPQHQKMGAGTMLLEEILAEADDAGVEVYLEATDTAKAFYERHGFQTITELRFNPAEYGIKGLGTERQTVMVRGAMSCSGERGEVRSWDAAVARAKRGLLQ